MFDSVVATLSPSMVDKASVIHTANRYLSERLGNQYHAIQPAQTKLDWQCLIQFCATESGKTVIAGQLDVDGQISTEQIFSIQTRVEYVTANLPRSAETPS